MASASRNSNPLDHGTVQLHTGCGWTPRFIDNAYMSMTDSRRAQNSRQDVPAQGSFADTRMYASLNPTPCSGGGGGGGTFRSTFQDCGIAKDKLPKRNEGYPSDMTARLENPLRTNPHSFTARSPSHCNATPLSTILEQGSAASLKHLSYSRSGGQSSDLRTAENISPTCAKIFRAHRLREETSSGDNQPPRGFIQGKTGEECSGESYSLGAVAGSTSFANHCQPGIMQLSANKQESDEGLVHETVQHIEHNPTSFTSPFLSAEPRFHARSRKSCCAKLEPLTSEMHVTQPSGSRNVSACSMTRSLSFSDLSDSKYGGTTASMYAVPPNSCGAWIEHDLAKATTLVQGNGELRSPNLLEAPPRCIDDHAQSISQNPSFCSTASTSYSGIVLGIDLDVGYDLQQQRARCTDSPVWFTPIENTEKSSHVKSERRDIVEEEEPWEGHSITSSALSALLPIAVAEGIVRANLQTPRISFHSPSGNLILEENINTPLPRRRIHSKPYRQNQTFPYLGVSGRSRAWNALATAATDDYLHAPTPMPIATPSKISASLPHHLRSKDNENRAQPPHIPDVETVMRPSTRTRINSKLESCGDMIIGTGPDDHCQIGTTRDNENHESSVLPRSRSEASRSRSLRFPIWHTAQKGRTLQKRRHPKRAENGLDLIAGHMMRVCFCQPYDGVGAKSKKTATRGSLDDQYRNEKSRRAPCESQTPNTRIVDATLEKRLGNKARA